MNGVRALLLDADGNLFRSEEPAFVASTVVLNRLMEEVGSAERYDPEELRLATTGKNFRTTAVDLAARAGVELSADELERWVAEEKAAVTEHLRGELLPDEDVVGTLRRLAERYALAVVSSSALSRLDACFEVTDLADLLPADQRFSAEDSLDRPTSKPDPAVYLHALAQLGIEAHEAIAVEDSPTGAQSAVAAGIATVGNVRFVADDERDQRVAELEDAGVFAVVASWRELGELLGAAPVSLQG